MTSPAAVPTATSQAGPEKPVASGPFKRPESVLVVVFTQRGEFLLLRRTWPRGFWQSVTGSLLEGETARAAAIRELGEETGISAPSALIDLGCSRRFPIPPRWRRTRYAPGVHYNREHWFALLLPHRRQVHLNPREHLDHIWVAPARAASLTGSWTNRLAIQQLSRMAGVM